MGKTHDFQVQKRIGEQAELLLDRFIAAHCYLEKASRHLQRQGIDRVIQLDGRTFYLEYKADFKAHQTGTAFIEVISADAGHTASGWATTSKADLLIYFLPRIGRVYVVPMFRLRQQMRHWEGYAIGKARNSHYHTHGLLVPLQELERVSEVAQFRITHHVHKKPACFTSTAQRS